MVSPHLKETLDRYHLGDKLRHLRLRRKMGLVELSRHTGLSPALLSKLEHGKAVSDAANAFAHRAGLQRGPGILLRRRKGAAHLRAGAQEGPTAFSGGAGLGDRAPLISSRSITWRTDRKFNAYLADFRNVAAEQVRLHQHAGVEFIYVLKGKLALKVGAEQEFLEEGDSLYFDSQLPHGYSRVGSKTLHRAGHHRGVALRSGSHIHRGHRSFIPFFHDAYHSQDVIPTGGTAPFAVPEWKDPSGTSDLLASSLLKNLASVIPNGVCEVKYGFASHAFCAMNLSFLSILIEEGFIASLGMTATRIFQQPARAGRRGRNASSAPATREGRG